MPLISRNNSYHVFCTIIAWSKPPWDESEPRRSLCPSLPAWRKPQAPLHVGAWMYSPWGLNLVPTTLVLVRSGITWNNLKMQKFSTSPLLFFSFWNSVRKEWVKSVRKWIQRRKCWSVHHKHKYCKILVLIRKQPHNSEYAEVAGCFQKMLIHRHQNFLWEHTH